MASRSWKLVAPFVLGAGFVLTPAPRALAQSETERSGARAAAEAGLSAYNAGRYAESYDLLNRAESLIHALPHLLYMARASEKLGLLVRAREIYLKIGREELTAGAPRAFVEAQQSAEQELQAINTRLPFITITLEGAKPTEVRVTIDGREVPAVLLDVPFPADPGSHVIVANGQGIGSEPRNVVFSEGKRELITLKVAAKTGATLAPPAPATPEQPATPPATAHQPVVTNNEATPPGADKGAKPSGESGRSPILAYTALGIGAVGLGVGTVFLIQRSAKQSDADKGFDACKTRVCTDHERNDFLDLDEAAATAGTVSLIGFGVGAVAVTTGLYLLFTHDSKSTSAASTPRFMPYVGVSQAGATFRF